MGRRTVCHCKGCNASIIFMITATGKMIPVDYKPELDDISQFDPKKMVSHFSTCTQAEAFRKKKKL